MRFLPRMKLPSRGGSDNGKTRSITILRSVTLVSRFLQYCSSVIVIAIASYFIRDYHQAGEHMFYQEVIVSTFSDISRLAPPLTSCVVNNKCRILPRTTRSLVLEETNLARTTT
jgi:hypothetical protein